MALFKSFEECISTKSFYFNENSLILKKKEKYMSFKIKCGEYLNKLKLSI